MNIIISVLAIAVVSGSIYSLTTGEYGIQPYIQLLLGFMIFASGIKILLESRKYRKAIAIFSFLASGFVLFVSIYVLLS